ncbi:MAG: putative rRNA maturation factor [Woeseiaceae bacterium]|jgi:probable rRNA maturation factor
MASDTVAVNVQIASNVVSIPDEDEIGTWLRQVLAESGNREGLEISVRVVDEAESRDLNKRFRTIDNSTNVLSFPADSAGLPAEFAPALGDIVICGPVVEREALQQGKDIGHHWAHLIVHGALHLLGYDHETEDDAEIMESLERKILAARGISDPYAEIH